jgi:hypothetical protein
VDAEKLEETQDFPIGSLEQAFVDDCFYEPDALLLDQILEINAEERLVRASMPTHPQLPITSGQKTHPIHHPPHVSGGLMVHMTGVIAFVHFYYLLGLRHSDGWIGYGVRIHQARFHALADTERPLVLECRADRVPRIRRKFLLRYQFRFTQGDSLVYEGDQTAMWMRTSDAAGHAGAEAR